MASCAPHKAWVPTVCGGITSEAVQPLLVRVDRKESPTLCEPGNVSSEG